MSLKQKKPRSNSAKPGGLGNPAKKAKPMKSPIRSDLYSDASVEELRSQHDNSGPYRHITIDGLCDESRMRAVHEEAINTMKTNFKETDLFKVYQTGDLMSLDSEPKKARLVPELLSLRSALYSKEFREFVSKITGVSDLTDRCDCSGNAYTQGCHLLCHDDVIGTRRVSYIIYMTDPDDDFTAEDGGSLELYPLDPKTITMTPIEKDNYMSELEQGIPTNVPTKKILPHFNRMALFTVQPGRSYHSVEEVYTSEKVRLSISGWYHGPCPPLGSDQASLAQVMNAGNRVANHTLYPTLTEQYYAENKLALTTISATPASTSIKDKDEDEEFQLSPSDFEYLSKYINPIYLRSEDMSLLREKFIDDSAVQLSDF